MRYSYLVLLAFIWLFGAGCGGEPVPLRVPASSPVRGLVVRVQGSEQHPRLHARLAIVQALRAAGYRVELDDARYDLTATVQVETGQAHVTSFLIIRGPNAVRLMLRLTAGNEIIEELQTEFVADESGVEPSDLEEIVTTLVNSPRVYQFAKERLEARATEARLVEEHREAERVAREEQERRAQAEETAAWRTAKPTTCSTPTTLDACEGVSGYLAKYPEGQHAARAQELLEKAEEPLRAMHDDLAWDTIDHDACEKPRTESACEGPTSYLSRYPKGNHAARAHELIENARPLIEKMRVARERRETAEAARAAARDSSEQEGSSYGDGSYSSGRSSGGGSVQVRGYTRKNGTHVSPHTRSRPRR
jgi:hypothetical protein